MVKDILMSLKRPDWDPRDKVLTLADGTTVAGGDLLALQCCLAVSMTKSKEAGTQYPSWIEVILVFRSGNVAKRRVLFRSRITQVT